MIEFPFPISERFLPVVVLLAEDLPLPLVAGELSVELDAALDALQAARVPLPLRRREEELVCDPESASGAKRQRATVLRRHGVLCRRRVGTRRERRRGHHRRRRRRPLLHVQEAAVSAGRVWRGRKERFRGGQTLKEVIS